MKTYALYLLILCFSVIGCQKDIGENDPVLKKGKTNLKYLPTELVFLFKEEANADSTKFVFSYYNDEGDLASISENYYSPSRQSYDVNYFTYKNNKLHTVGREGDWIGLSGPSVFTFTFNGDKASGYRSEHWAGYEDPFWPTVPPDENGEYPPAPVYWQLELYDSTTIAWSNSKLASFKNSNGKLTFNYTNDLLTSIQPETGSSFERQIGTITYSYENKNYWAKYIRNKDILMLLFSRVFHPLEQNPTKICVKGKDNYDTEILETYEYKSKYNEDGYPIEICETHSGIRHNTHEPFKVSTTYIIRYKTIPHLN